MQFLFHGCESTCTEHTKKLMQSECVAHFCCCCCWNSRMSISYIFISNEHMSAMRLFEGKNAVQTMNIRRGLVEMHLKAAVKVFAFFLLLHCKLSLCFTSPFNELNELEINVILIILNTFEQCVILLEVFFYCLIAVVHRRLAIIELFCWDGIERNILE